MTNKGATSVLDLFTISNPSVADLVMLTGDQLARLQGFEGVTSSFRSWCTQVGITTVPGRRDIYDPRHVRQRLDAIQMNHPAPANTDVLVSTPMQQRKARMSHG
ncbi:hypothetical protein [Rubellimicrobium arenae]|uniref:hypothetical protein n=1 Tax=Rubellimicrobium arenae TaxID=2817372 RepID=UPI001B308F6F|nr:hypothetical protein [Rubellimicrobium arenae]